MKKTIFMIMVLTGCALLSACAVPAATNDSQNVSVSDDLTEEMGRTAEGDGQTEDMADEETADEDTADEETTDEETDDAETVVESEDSFVFSYKGLDIRMNQDMSEVLEVLGEPNSYFEAASCAFDGMDRMYTYSSFEIDSYPDGDMERVSAIYFKDDLVTTAEGISLYMMKDDMEEAYGTDYEVVDSSCIYSRGGSTLTFILNDSDEIISIEYQTNVDYN